MVIETSKTEIQREKRMKKTEQNIQELWENNLYMWWDHQKAKRKRKGNRRNTWRINEWEFLKTNDKHQTIDLGNSENTKQDAHQKKKNFFLIPRHIIFKVKTKDKEKILVEAKRKKKYTLLKEEQE